jgi:hypothetical protein
MRALLLLSRGGVRARNQRQLGRIEHAQAEHQWGPPGAILAQVKVHVRMSCTWCHRHGANGARTTLIWPELLASARDVSVSENRVLLLCMLVLLFSSFSWLFLVCVLVPAGTGQQSGRRTRGGGRGGGGGIQQPQARRGGRGRYWSGTGAALDV